MELTIDSALSPAAYVGHTGYVLLIISMLMTKMLWLRVFAIGSGLLEITYATVWLSDPVSAIWEAIFILTNVGQVIILLHRNHRARFTADEHAFYQTAVPSLEPSSARRLLLAGRWLTAEPGTILVHEGQLAEELLFIVEGEVDIRIHDQALGECGPGTFVGEISVSSGVPATATAVASTPIRYLAFKRDTVRRMLDKADEVGVALEFAMRCGLQEKLVRTNAALIAARRSAIA